MNLAEVTIVVPTRNEASNIERFLASIPPALRLVVVDSSEDETPDAVERLRPNRGRARADQSNVLCLGARRSVVLRPAVPAEPGA